MVIRRHEGRVGVDGLQARPVVLQALVAHGRQDVGHGHRQVRLDLALLLAVELVHVGAEQGGAPLAPAGLVAALGPAINQSTVNSCAAADWSQQGVPGNVVEAHGRVPVDAGAAAPVARVLDEFQRVTFQAGRVVLRRRQSLADARQELGHQLVGVARVELVQPQRRQQLVRQQSTHGLSQCFHFQIRGSP